MFVVLIIQSIYARGTNQIGPSIRNQLLGTSTLRRRVPLRTSLPCDIIELLYADKRKIVVQRQAEDPLSPWL
jgi:hypothetical protein